jgi:hypothetical protein
LSERSVEHSSLAPKETFIVKGASISNPCLAPMETFIVTEFSLQTATPSSQGRLLLSLSEPVTEGTLYALCRFRSLIEFSLLAVRLQI